MIATLPIDDLLERATRESWRDRLVRAIDEGWARWIGTASDVEAVRLGCYFDQRAAERPPLFFRKFLRHYKGKFKSQPFDLLDWQRDRVILPLYGWKRPDGWRRFRKVYLTVAKKNGKTGLGSAIAVYELVGDGEPGAKCYLSANAEEQAGNSFDDCAKMIKHSPQLNDVLKVNESTHRIVYAAADSFLTAIPANPDANDGIDGSFVLIDELHLAPSREMYDVLQFAGEARRQPIFLITTTAGDGNDVDGIAREEYDYAKSVLAGTVIDIGYLPVIFEAEAGDDVRDPATWEKANPSMGVTIDRARFAEDVTAALGSPSRMTNVKRRKLNMWVGSPKHFIAREAWDACRGELPAELASVKCILGLDLGDTSDLTAAVDVKRFGKKIFVRAQFFSPEETVDARTSEGRLPYRAWVDGGWIIPTPGASIDFESIDEWLLSRCGRGDVSEVAYDPYQAIATINKLTGKGILCVKVPQQVPHIAPATKELERLVLSGQIVHDGNPVLAWMIGNVVPRVDNNGNIMPLKGKKSKKIDGATALITALSRVMVYAPRPASIYRKHGVITGG